MSTDPPDHPVVAATEVAMDGAMRALGQAANAFDVVVIIAEPGSAGVCNFATNTVGASSMAQILMATLRSLLDGGEVRVVETRMPDARG